MKKVPFALKTPFYIHGFLYVLAAHLSGYLMGELAFLLLPTDWTHLPYLFSLGGCVLSLPLFFRWFFRNENPIGYPVVTAVSQLACGLGGVVLYFPILALGNALARVVPPDPDKLNPWSLIAVWISVAVFFGALLILLCLGLLVYALIRRKHSAKNAPPVPFPETTTDT